LTGNLGAEGREGFLYGETPEDQVTAASNMGGMWSGEIQQVHQNRIQRSDYIQSLYDEVMPSDTTIATLHTAISTLHTTI